MSKIDNVYLKLCELMKLFCTGVEIKKSGVKTLICKTFFYLAKVY